MGLLPAEAPSNHPDVTLLFEGLLWSLLAACSASERMAAGGQLIEAGLGFEWVRDDCGRGPGLYQIERFIGHLQRTEPAHLERTLAEDGLAAGLHSPTRVRPVSSQIAAADAWWSRLRGAAT